MIERKEQYWVGREHFDTEEEAKTYQWESTAREKLNEVLDVYPREGTTRTLTTHDIVLHRKEIMEILNDNR